MVSWRTAAVLWLVAGLSSALLVPYMTDQLLLAVFAIGAVVGIVLAATSLLRRSDRLARWSTVIGAVWLVVFVAITLANLGDPIEYLLPVVWIAVFGAAAGWVSYRLARAR
jgi:FtsH-binding integral membrane protein